MTVNEVLWILCGVALVAMALISLLFGSAARTRSLDDVYARRAQRLGAVPAETGTHDELDLPDDPTTPATAPRRRVGGGVARPAPAPATA